MKPATFCRLNAQTAAAVEGAAYCVASSTLARHNVSVLEAEERRHYTRGDDSMSAEQCNVAPADFAELPRGAAGGTGQLNLDLIMDVRLVLTLEVGRTRMSVRNLLALTQGSVVELDKLAGEPLDVLVNGTLVLTAVVVVNDSFGIRLLDVVSPEKRGVAEGMTRLPAHSLARLHAPTRHSPRRVMATDRS
jgi:flagellar motor switch protein FliN/FliY